MVVACTLSQYHLAFFHLLNHAFFKALLFLTAGAIIHTFNNEQDIIIKWGFQCLCDGYPEISYRPEGIRSRGDQSKAT